MNKYYQNNKEKVLAKQKVRYQENKEEILAQCKAYREKRKINNPEYGVANRELSWERQLKKHGWTRELYEEIAKEQEYKCAICNQPVENRRLDADHMHTIPPLPRGLLCNKHNQMIGLSGDDPALLRKAAEYIEKYNSD